MTIEELTFTAFQQGREQGREESAAQIERLREALRRVIAVSDRQTDDYAFARAALQPEENDQ
jgi:hypothetical protein